MLNTSPQIRILFVQRHAYKTAGVSRSLLGILEQLDREKYEPHVLFLVASGEIIQRVQALGIHTLTRADITTFGHTVPGAPTFFRFPPWQPLVMMKNIWPSAKKFAQFLREEGPYDIVYLNSATMMPAALGCKLAGVAPVIHVREMLAQGTFGLRKRIFRNILENVAAHLIVLSNASKAEFTGKVPITIVYNAIDFSVFDHNIDPFKAKQKLGIDQDVQLIVILGGALRHKGAHILIRAAKIIANKHPQARVAVLGYTEPVPKRLLGRIRRRLWPYNALRLKKLI